MPRAPWRRRRTTDSPRPAGRRWAGSLRRSGTFARQVLLVRVGRRSREAGRRVRPRAGPTVTTPTRLPAGRYGRRLARAEVESIAPVSPALGPANAVDDAEPGMAIPLLPGERTMARRMQFALVNGCTLASLMLGLLAIFLAMHGDVQARGRLPDRLRGLRRPRRRARPQARRGAARSARRWTRWPTCARSAWPPGGGLRVAGRLGAHRRGGGRPAPWSRPARRSGWPGSTSRRRTAGSSAACRPRWPRRCSPWPC